jgi:predicted permease
MVIFVAVSPLLYGLLMTKFHFPNPPIWIVLFFWLGIPGMLVANAIAGPSDTSSLTVAIIAAWVFYFGVFRGIASWTQFRDWMRERAADYVHKSDKEKR